MLVSKYDVTKTQTVSEFFNSTLRPKAYASIRDLGMQSDDSYRPADKARGKGSRLYSLQQLQQVQDTLDIEARDVVIKLPDGHTDLARIAGKYGVEMYVLSAVFSLVGLKPKSQYLREGAKRKVNAFACAEVDIVMSSIDEIRDDLVVLSGIEDSD